MPSSKLAPEFLTLKSRALRDLAWSFTCSSLFSPIEAMPREWFKTDYIAKAHLLNWLQTVDKSQRPLVRHLSEQRSTRLGIYFEQLLSFYFKYYESGGVRRFTLLATNHQVTENKRTIGEFDFIVLDNISGDTKHIEVAVKFYLGHSNYNQSGPYPIEKNQPLYNWHNWVGPNFRDTLAIKMCHLQEHQLLLSRSLAGKESLSQLLQKNNCKIATNIQCRLHMSGRFFSPLFESIDEPKFALQAVTDFWLYDSVFFETLERNIWHKTIQGLCNTSAIQYCLLPKQYWLSEITRQDIEEAQLLLLDDNSLMDFLKSDEQENQWHLALINQQRVDKPLAYRQKSSAPTLTIEHCRFFIIRDQQT